MTRFRAVDPTKLPCVFGQIKVLADNVYNYDDAIVWLDGKFTPADKSGSYRLILTPGKHEFMVGQIGIIQSRLRLNVEPGDSVRINFHLRPDLTPLD